MTSHDHEDLQPHWWKRNIITPSNAFERDAVLHAQRVLRCAETSEMDESTVAAIRGFQMLFALPATGVLDKATATQIERVRNFYAV